MALLEARGVAEAKDSKTVRVLSFDVPAGVEALALRFDYAPRTSLDRAHNTALVEGALDHHHRSCAYVAHAKPEGERREAERREVANLYRELHNLMNVVLIDPQGRWRGRWDRNPSSDDGVLLLSRTHASKGFLPGELTPGRWTAAIECHGVFGDAVAYQLSVEARASEGAPSQAAPKPSSGGRLRRRGPGWYFGELHAHSFHSDGRNDVRELAEKARALGIDFVALTDHNTMSGFGEVDLDDLPITLIRGCELTTFYGHHPIYGVSELVPWHEDGRVLALFEMAPRVRAQGGLVSVAHPFKLGDPICTGCRMPDGLDPSGFDLFEVWYRRWDAAESDNEAAYALWNRYWQEGRRITAVAARDWHGPSQEKPFPGIFPFTGVYALDSTEEAILAGLASGRVIMSGGPILDLQLSGERNLSVAIERLDGEAELRIFRRGERVLSLPTRAGAFEIEGLSDSQAWYRAELWSDGRPLCITNHVVKESPR